MHGIVSRAGRYSGGQMMRLAARLPACADYIKSVKASLKGPAARFRAAMFIGYWQSDCTYVGFHHAAARQQTNSTEQRA